MYSKVIKELQAAKAKLTETSWNKGFYFQLKNKELCMCAHGAVQSESNPTCKSIVVRGVEAAVVGNAVEAVGNAVAVAVATAAATAAAAMPNWVKKDSTEYGNTIANYLLAYVGCTFNYNDSPETTLAMVHTKFDEAIALAKQLACSECR